MCECMCPPVAACGGLKRMSDPRELKWQAVITTYVGAGKLCSSVRVPSDLSSKHPAYPITFCFMR